MDEEIIAKYRKVGGIASNVREWSRKLVKPGAKAFDIAEEIEARILDKAEIAFPLNISINDIAAHYSPEYKDELELKEGDLVTIDLGAHLDGYIADTAYTIDLGNDNGDLIKASQEGLKAAIETIEPGIKTSEIGRAVNNTITSFGFKPISNLTGHQLEKYDLHAGLAIPNVEMAHEETVPDGVAVAIEPFATPGSGMVVESKDAYIYSFLRKTPTRFREGKKLLEDVEKRQRLPFAERWFGKGMNKIKLQMVFRELVQRNALRAYPVLHEKERALVSQTEHTVLLVGGEKIVTTE